MNLFGLRKKINSKSMTAETSESLADRLRETTISKLYKKNFEEPPAIPPLTSEQIWEHRHSGSQQMLSDLMEAASKAAELGYHELQVEFISYDETYPMSFSIGLEIEDRDLESDGKVNLEIWPFYYKDASGTKRNSFERVGVAEDFKSLVVCKIYDHFKQQGLTVREVDLYEEYYRPFQYAQPYTQTCPEYDESNWNTVLSISWMKDEEYRQAKAAMAIYGGYEAYSKGVPLEDIIA